MKTVVVVNCPSPTVEHPQFHRLLNMLKPSLGIPSPTTIQRSILHYAEEVQEKLKKCIPDDTLLHLATDCGTSPNKLPFMYTTLQYIDRDWQLRQHTIGFLFLGGEAYNAIDLGNKLSQLIRDLDITTRILAIVSNNASVNTVLARHLQTNVFGQKWDAQQY